MLGVFVFYIKIITFYFKNRYKKICIQIDSNVPDFPLFYPHDPYHHLQNLYPLLSLIKETAQKQE